MKLRIGAALVVAAVIAAGCGGDADDSEAAPEATTPTTTEAPAPATSTTQAPAADTDVSVTEPEPEPEPQDVPAVEDPDASRADPSDAYFDLGRVLDVSIEIDVEDWDTLRHQTRTLEDVFAEIEKFGLSQPFANIYTWFSATVTVDGETHERVGVRKKGFVGSQSSTKPSLKLRFDKYVDGQSLGGIIERMTLNNSVQDPSFVNTCLSYQVFAAAGHPASRCSFATVTVNGKELGLYTHVEEIKAPMLGRYFDSTDGNLYEGTVSDFTATFRGTFEKKTNEDADDWSDIDAVVAALEDPTDAGLEALGEIVDLDRYLTHWAAEVLIGHWDGYAGDRNNYWFYREPAGRFVFLPWGVDSTFHLSDDPNPFDNISDPPPSVLALTAIPNRLYNHPDWRDAYVERLKGVIDTVWDTDVLLASVDEMVAVVEQHALPDERRAAEADTERVRKFILKREEEILADLTPTPPEWPEPDFDEAIGSGSLELEFETVWGSNQNLNPLAAGTVHSLVVDGTPEPPEQFGAFAGASGDDERALLRGGGEPASIIVAGVDDDGSVSGMTMVVDQADLVDGAEFEIGTDRIGVLVWSIEAGSSEPRTSRSSPRVCSNCHRPAPCPAIS